MTSSLPTAAVGLLLLLSLAGADAPGTSHTPAKPKYQTQNDILYRPDLAKTDEYADKMCRLKFYFPTNVKNFPTVVWFHGGGLEVGDAELPEPLRNQGIGIVGVQYRLAPNVKNPAYTQDAAAAVAWAFKHVAEQGGDPDSIYVAGHSAGGYLASMVGLDQRWLAAEGVDANKLAGIISFSGHAITHFTIRKERGIPDTIAVVDEFAPLYHVRADAPPLLLMTGDREKELLGRYEEVAYLARMMKVAGHKQTTLYEFQGFDHGNMPRPANDMLLKFIREQQEKKAPKTNPGTAE